MNESNLGGIKSDATFRALDTAKVNNLTSWALIACVLIASVLSLGKVTFTFQEAISVSTLCIILFLVSSLIYRTKYTEYEAKAKQCPEYIAIDKTYNELVNRIHNEGLLVRLPELCQRYVDEELKTFRTAILANACIPYSVYATDYANKSVKELKSLPISKSMRKAICRANKAKCLKLNAQSLLSVSKQGFIRFSALMISSGQRETIDSALNVVSRMFTTFLGGAVTVAVIIDWSWQSLVQWGIKMLPLAMAAYSGATQGTKNIFQTAIPHKKSQINIIATILEWEKQQT